MSLKLGMGLVSITSSFCESFWDNFFLALSTANLQAAGSIEPNSFPVVLPVANPITLQSLIVA